MGAGNTEICLLEGSTSLGAFTVNGSGTATSWYFTVLAGDRVIGRQPNTGSRSYYHSDLLGSTRSVVQGTTVVESYDFEPWGLQMPGRTLGSGTKEGFTGKEQDAETGLDYFGARYYLPAIGRFGAPDPQAAKFGEWSAYSYTLNNPLALVDRDGREPGPPLDPRQARAVAIGSGVGATFGGAVALGCSAGTAGVCALGSVPIITSFAAAGAAAGGLASAVSTYGEGAVVEAMAAASRLGKALGKAVDKVTKAIAAIKIIVTVTTASPPPQFEPAEPPKKQEQPDKAKTSKPTGGSGGEPPKPPRGKVRIGTEQ